MLLALVLFLPPDSPKPAASSPAKLLGIVDGTGKTVQGGTLLKGPIAGLTGRAQDRFAVIEIAGQAAPSVAYRDPKTPSGARPGFPIPNAGQPSWLFAKPLIEGDPEPRSLGLATGTWKKVGSVALKQGVMDKAEGLKFLRILRPETTATARQNLVADMALPTDGLSNAYEVRLIGRTGKPMPLEKRTFSPTDPSDVSFTFRGAFEDAARLELWSRPYRWITASGG